MSRYGMAWLTRIADSAKRADTVIPMLADAYEFSAPTYQNAIDLLPGWNHAFPSEMKLNAGPGFMYEDPRIYWAAEQTGGLEGKRVLELGPLEASHTSMLERLGARRIDAIEANKGAYLRCLVAKEILGLRRARFHLGDFVRGLEAPMRYDLIVACGVLYHMSDPLALLERMAARTNLIYLWTHYFDDQEMPATDSRRVAFSVPERNRQEVTETKSFHGVEMKLHLRSYYKAWTKTQYCGGPVDRHFWLEKAQLIDALRALGFGDLSVAHEDANHPNGPAMSVFARRN
jgi:hypothetical protein